MKKTRKFLCAAAVVMAAVLMASCSSTKGADSDGSSTEKSSTEKKSKEKSSKKKKKGKETFSQAEFDAAFAAGDYATCLSMLQEKNDDKNAIKDSLDADMLLHLNGDYLDSAKAYMETQAAMQQVSKDTSGGKAFTAAIAGENSVSYAGTTYERILSYAMRAANALALGDVSNAKGVIDNYTGDYKDIIAPLVAAEKELAEQSEGCLQSDEIVNALNTLEQVASVAPDIAGLVSNMRAIINVQTGKPEKKEVQYEESSFLSYLGTVIYAANGDAGHAKDFASRLRALKPEVNVSEGVSVPAGKGRLDVVALSGTIGKRTDKSDTEELTSMGTIPLTPVPLNFKLAYPTYDPKLQNHAIDTVRVTLSDGQKGTATLIEDFDKAVAIDVAFKARGAYNRSLFRNITKSAATIPASITAVVAAEELRAKNALLGDKAYAKAIEGLTLGVNAIASLEKADLRQAYFPHMASAAGFTVAPGTYSVKVEYLSGGSVVETKELSDIVVEAGKPTVVVSSCAK